MKIGDKIRAIRTMKGYSQEYMAAKLHMSQSAYGKIERGKTDITVNRLKQVSDLLGLSNPADILLFDAEDLLSRISSKYKNKTA